MTSEELVIVKGYPQIDQQTAVAFLLTKSVNIAQCANGGT